MNLGDLGKVVQLLTEYLWLQVQLSFFSLLPLFCILGSKGSSLLYYLFLIILGISGEDRCMLWARLLGTWEFSPLHFDEGFDSRSSGRKLKGNFGISPIDYIITLPYLLSCYFLPPQGYSMKSHISSKSLSVTLEEYPNSDLPLFSILSSAFRLIALWKGIYLLIQCKGLTKGILGYHD